MKITSLKTELHPRNKHRGLYPLKALTELTPELKLYLKRNPNQEETLDFSDPKAVFLLNKSLLNYYYGIKNWTLPENALCPPIPGRVDMIHYLADLLSETLGQKNCMGRSIRVLDIGCGANCIYPLLGQSEYGWSFVGSEIQPASIDAAKKLISNHPIIGDHPTSIEIREQHSPLTSKGLHPFFKGILKPGEFFELSLCNPPFYATEAEAIESNARKTRGLEKNKLKNNTFKKNNLPKFSTEKPGRNFGGLENELWCKGGEKLFISEMIKESVFFSKQVRWFTCLVSREETLSHLNKTIVTIPVTKTKLIELSQGQKKSRVVAWSFL